MNNSFLFDLIILFHFREYVKKHATELIGF